MRGISRMSWIVSYLSNTLQLNDRTYHWNNDGNNICPLCKNGIEDLKHFMFICKPLQCIRAAEYKSLENQLKTNNLEAIWQLFISSAPFQITVLVRFSSVWFSLVTVLLIVCPRSLLLCPFHKKLRIWWKKSFGSCQTDNPRSSFMMYCYSTDLNVYTWVELNYQNRQVFWIQFLT